MSEAPENNPTQNTEGDSSTKAQPAAAKRAKPAFRFNIKKPAQAVAKSAQKTETEKPAPKPASEAQTDNAALERHFAAGEYIFEEGEIGDVAFVVVSGTVEICKLSGGEVITLQKLEKDTLFGEMAIIDKSPRSASARAGTDVVVREVNEQALMAHIKRAPDVALNMMYRLASYVRTSNKNLESSVFESGPTEQGGESAPAVESSAKDKPKYSADIQEVIDEFQIQNVEMEKKKLPSLAKTSLGVIISLVGAFILWASLSVIDTTISARGRLTTTVPTITVQSTDNSVVKTVHVTVGTSVKEGDLLVTLDETYTESDLARANNEYDQLSAKIERLTAEMAEADGSAAEAIDDPIQRSIFLNRLQEYRSKTSSMDQNIKNLNAKLKFSSDDIKLAKAQLGIKSELEEARRTLFKKNVGSQLNYLQAKNDRLVAQREYHDLQNTFNNLKGELEAQKAERQAFISGWFSEIGVQLSEASNQRDSINEELVKLRRKKENVQILAPADGVIISQENLFRGAIVSEGATVMTLVPSDVPLTVEMDIDPRDIGNLFMGAKSSVKLDALPYQKHGDLEGAISFVAEDTVSESLTGEKGTFYRARTNIDANNLRALPADFRLMPGMLLTADIKSGKRRLITYFIYPVIRTIETSFTEPGK